VPINQVELVQALSLIVQDGPFLPNLQGVKWITDHQPVQGLDRLISSRSMHSLHIHRPASEDDYGEKDMGMVLLTEEENEILDVIIECSLKLYNLTLVNLTVGADNPGVERFIKSLNISHLTSLFLHPGPKSMSSPLMGRLLALPSMQHLTIQHQSSWSLELRSRAFGLDYLTYCCLSDSYDRLLDTLRQLLIGHDIIRSTSSLTISASEHATPISIEDWCSCWRDCAASVHQVGLSLTIEPLRLKDNPWAVGDRNTFSLDFLESFRECTNAVFIEYTLFLAETDEGYRQACRTYGLVSQIQQIAKQWPRVSHFGSDLVFHQDVLQGQQDKNEGENENENENEEDERWMNIFDLDQIVRVLPSTLTSIRIGISMPYNWHEVAISSSKQHLNLKSVHLHCDVVDIAEALRTIRPQRNREVQHIRDLGRNPNTIQRVVDLLLSHFPSMTSVKLGNHPPLVLERALHTIQQLRTIHQLEVDRVDDREVSAGDVLLIKDGGSSPRKSSTCIASPFSTP
jgi:hypothetical protein